MTKHDQTLSVKDAYRIRNNPDLILCPVCKERGVLVWVNRKRMARHLRKHLRGGYMERDVGELPPKSRSPPTLNINMKGGK